MSNKLPPLSGPVDASGEPECPECGYFVGHKDFCAVGHRRATAATPPSDTLMVRNAAEFAVRAVADTLLTVLLELPNRYGDNHTIDRRIAIAAAQKMKADAIRAVDAAILNSAAAAVPSSPDEPICGAGVNHMGKLRNRCGGTGQPSITGPNGIGRQCPACGMLTVPYPNGTVRKHGVLANSVGGGVPRLFANFCQDEHEPINHNDSEHERCPLCRANDEIAVLRARLAALPPSSPVADSPKPDYWRCKTCGCLWRDNHDGTVSLASVNQTSCQTCEMEPSHIACEPLFLRSILVDRDAEVRREMRAYLDTFTIHGDNIGGIRRTLFMPFDSQWNGWVREDTAAREISTPHPVPPAKGEK